MTLVWEMAARQELARLELTSVPLLHHVYLLLLSMGTPLWK